MNIILKNFSLLTTAHIIEKVISFIIIIVLARYLGAEGYGIYALALSFIGLFIQLLDGGLNCLLMRETARKVADRQQLLGRVLAGKVIMGVVVFLGIVCLAIGLAYPKDALYSILIYGIAMIILSFTDTFRAVFLAFEKAEFEGLLLTLNRFLLLGGIVFCVVLHIRIPEIMVSYLVSSLIVLWLGSYLCKKIFFTPSWDMDYKSIKNLFKEAMPFAVGAMMAEIFYNIDNVMISKMVGLESVGYYNAAYKLSYSGVLLANTMTLAIFPYLTKNWLGDKNKVFDMFRKLFKMFIILSMAFSLTAAILSDHIIVLVFGNQFKESIVLFQLLVFALPPLFLMHLTNRTLDAIGEQRFKANTMIAGVVINIVLNFILIYKFKAVGASIATVITSIFLVVVHTIYLKRRMGFSGIGVSFIKIPVCLIGMSVVILLLKDYNWFVAAFTGLTVYSGLLFLLKVLKREDWECRNVIAQRHEAPKYYD